MSPMQVTVCTAFYELMLEADSDHQPGEPVVFDVSPQMQSYLRGKQLVVDCDGQVTVRPKQKRKPRPAPSARQRYRIDFPPAENHPAVGDQRS